MKRVHMKLTTQETLTVDMKEDMANDAIFSELLQGKKEYVMIGNCAISKDQIAYVTIQETDSSTDTIGDDAPVAPVDNVQPEEQAEVPQGAEHAHAADDVTEVAADGQDVSQAVDKILSCPDCQNDNPA